MTLEEFHREVRSQVLEHITERRGTTGKPFPYPESVFSEVMMSHMAAVGMTVEPEVCHCEMRIGNARLRLSGYAVSEDSDQLDLFVSLYDDSEDIAFVPDSRTKKAAEQCLRFLAESVNGRLADRMEQSNDAYHLVQIIQESYAEVDQIRIYVLTDGRAKSKNFKDREVGGRSIRLEVMDIERLFRHCLEGRPRDELVMDFDDLSGGPIPCVHVPDESSDYDYAMAVIPGDALGFIYEKYGDRLLEANVRSFLSVTGKVNKGIRDTIRTTPQRFMAYNNGIVLTADDVRFGRTATGAPGIRWIKGIQIVNGGQTTASLYFTRRKNVGVDLGRVRVPAKIILLKSHDADEEALIADISRYANSQNAVRQSDLAANNPFHREIEELSSTVYCPDGVSRWFYERAAGSYKTMMAMKGTTRARVRALRQTMPTSRKIGKTDLAKCLNAWAGLPHVVSRGAQKNFAEFMSRLNDDDSPYRTMDVKAFKKMIAKFIVYKAAQKISRRLCSAFQANVTTYTVSIMAGRVGDDMDLDRVWQRQEVSGPLARQMETWAAEVNSVLHGTSRGLMISEWAKKTECWAAVRGNSYSRPASGIPELGTAGRSVELRGR